MRIGDVGKRSDRAGLRPEHRGRRGAGGGAREALGRGELHRRGSARRRRRRSCSRTSATGSCGSIPQTGSVTVFREPSGRANGLIFDPRGPPDRRRGGEHRRRPSGLDHRARRHRPHAGRPLRGQAVQQPQRRRRRSPRAGLCLRPPLCRRRAPRARLRGRLPDRPRRHASRGSKRPRQAQRPGHQPRRPARSTSPTTAQTAVSCSHSTSTPSRRTCRTPRVLHDFGSGRGIDGMTVTSRRPDRRHGRQRPECRRLRLRPEWPAPRRHPHSRAPHQRRVRRRRWQDRCTSPPARASTGSRRP